MKRFIFIILILSIRSTSFAQQTDSLARKLDSMHKEEAKAPEKPEIDVNKVDYTAHTNITFKSYFVLLGTDITQEVTGPFHTNARSWKKVAAFAAIEGVLVLSEKSIQKGSQNFMNNNPGAQNVSTYVTNFGGTWEGYTLAAFGLYGIIFHSNKVKTTTLLATQSYIVAGAVSDLLKFATNRERPNGFSEGQEPDNIIFRGPSLGGSNGNSFTSSFPSGHTTAAFAAATVFAQEYKDQTLIPVIAYSVATLVGVSRVTQNAHWASDVFAGAALGYVTGLQVVRNYHRYAKLQQAGKKPKVSWIYNLEYRDGVVMPGVVAKF